jgi:hypothetical protein
VKAVGLAAPGQVAVRVWTARALLDLVLQVQHTVTSPGSFALTVAGASTGARSVRTLQRDVGPAIADSGLPIG